MAARKQLTTRRLQLVTSFLQGNETMQKADCHNKLTWTTQSRNRSGILKLFSPKRLGCNFLISVQCVLGLPKKRLRA